MIARSLLLAAFFVTTASHAANEPTGPALDGPAGLVRTHSALMGDGTMMIGGWARGFYVSNFVFPGIDPSVFLEGGGSANIAFFRAVEVALQARGAALTNKALLSPAASVGDLTLSLKAGWSFGLFAAAALGQATLPTARLGFGYDVEATRFGGGLLLTFALTTIEVPLRIHVNGGYDSSVPGLTTGGRPADSLYLDVGPGGAVSSLVSQRWYWDRAYGAIGIEVPLPYITPFVDVWYQTAVLPLNYELFGDAHFYITPGLRVGNAGLALLLAGDFAISGHPGFVNDIIDGQPIAPTWAVRAALSHTFELFAVPTSGGGPDRGRVRICVKDDVQMLPQAMATSTAFLGRLAADEQGCIQGEADAGSDPITIQAPDHDQQIVDVVVRPGVQTDVDVTLVRSSGAAGVPAGVAGVTPPAAGQARLKGYVSNREDEIVAADVTVVGATTRSIKTAQGAYVVDEPAGPVRVLVKAAGYLLTGASLTLGAGNQTADFVLVAEPKKRSATLEKDHIALAARVPFEFRRPRLQSTAGFVLDEVVDVMLHHPELHIAIEAHTDALTNPEEEQALTDARAQAVTDYLVHHGVERVRLKAVGKGATMPVSKTEPDKNRRIDFVVVPAAGKQP